MNQEVINLLRGTTSAPFVGHRGDRDGMDWVKEPILPKFKYHDGLDVIVGPHREDMMSAMWKLRVLAADCPQMDKKLVAVLLDFIEWTVCVQRRTDLVFTEGEASKYFLHIIQSNIDYAAARNNPSLIADSSKLKSILDRFVLSSGLLSASSSSSKEDSLRNTSLFTKLQLLDIDIQLLRDRNFNQKTNVMKRIKRFLLMEQNEFNPHSILKNQDQNLSNIDGDDGDDDEVDSSPPIDSSIGDDRDESSHSKDLTHASILTQSTQINKLPSATESRVDVEATSSSNGNSQHSQHAKDSQKLLNGSAESQSHDPMGTRLNKIANRIHDVQIRNELLKFAKELKIENNAQSTFTEAYNKTKDAFRTIMENMETFKTVQSHLPTIQSVAESLSLPTENVNEISIRSNDSLRAKNKDSQDSISTQNQQLIEDIKNAIDAEVSDRKESTQIITGYFDRRIDKSNDITKGINEKLKSIENFHLTMIEIKEELKEFKESSVTNTHFGEVIQNIKKKVDTLIETSERYEQEFLANYDNVTSIDEKTRQALQKVVSLEKWNQQIENQIADLSKEVSYKLKKVSDKNDRSSDIESYKSIIDEVQKRSKDNMDSIKRLVKHLSDIYENLKQVNKFKVLMEDKIDVLRKSEIKAGKDNKKLAVNIENLNSQIGNCSSKEDIQNLQKQLDHVNDRFEEKASYDNAYLGEKFYQISGDIQKIMAKQSDLEAKLEKLNESNRARYNLLNSSPPPLPTSFQPQQQVASSSKALTNTRNDIDGNSSPELISEQVYYETSNSSKQNDALKTSQRRQNSTQKIRNPPLPQINFSSRISSLLQRERPSKKNSSESNQKKRSRSPSSIPETSDGLKHIKLFRALDD